MKLIHLSDLHLGIRVNEYSMIEDQKYILEQIIAAVDDEKPDCVIIAGDVYDRAVPSAEAVQLFDDLLWSLATREVKVFVISGNHDSAERMAFASRMLDAEGIHISRAYDGETQRVVLRDSLGEVNIYMLPFIKPANVRRYSEEEITSYTDAVRLAVSKMDVDETVRNVLVTHQFVTGSRRSESEEITVGGTDNVDVTVFERFDYVALGHIHSPQNCSSERVRYCGTPLKYSFSEAGENKSVTVVELAAKGELTVRTVPLTPMRDMVEIRGSYDELMSRSFYEGTTLREDYVHAILTDEEDVLDAVGRLRTVYKNLMKISYDNTRTRADVSIEATADVERISPLQLFAEFYETQNNQPMTKEQSDFMRRIMENVWERGV